MPHEITTAGKRIRMVFVAILVVIWKCLQGPDAV